VTDIASGKATALTNLLQFNPNGSMVCTAGQVAQLLGMSARSFDRQRAALIAAGFPSKLPGTNGWSRPAVVAWITSNGAPPPKAGAIAVGDPEIDAHVTRLEANYVQPSHARAS
jgi:predicted DNA-binding transcriptional regulator AlpA